MTDIRIRRIGDGPYPWTLEHTFDLGTLDLPLADHGYRTEEDAEEAAASLLAALGGGPD